MSTFSKTCLILTLALMGAVDAFWLQASSSYGRVGRETMSMRQNYGSQQSYGGGYGSYGGYYGGMQGGNRDYEGGGMMEQGRFRGVRDRQMRGYGSNGYGSNYGYGGGGMMDGHYGGGMMNSRMGYGQGMMSGYGGRMGYGQGGDYRMPRPRHHQYQENYVQQSQGYGMNRGQYDEYQFGRPLGGSHSNYGGGMSYGNRGYDSRFDDRMMTGGNRRGWDGPVNHN